MAARKKKAKASKTVVKRARKATKAKTAPAKKARKTKSKAARSARKPAQKAKASRKTSARKPAAKKKAPARGASARAGATRNRKQIVGEGDYEASRAFLKDQSDFVKENKGRIPEMGRQARAALEGSEGPALMAAEAEAKGHSKNQDAP